MGGSYAYRDTANGVAFALTKNRPAPDFDAAQRRTGLVDQHLA